MRHAAPVTASWESHHDLSQLNLLGSEQALTPVRLPDTFAEGAWDKVLKTEGTLDFIFPTTIVHSFDKKYIGIFFVR